MSFLRLALCPLFIWVFFAHSPEWSFIVFACASLLDVFDGFLARKLDAISTLGKIIDPLADKVLQLSAVVCFTVNETIPWFIIIVLGLKELTILIGGGIISKKRNDMVYSNTFGKIASFCTSFSLCMMFFVNGIFKSIALIIYVILYASVILSIFSLVQYAYITVIQPKSE